MAHPFEGPAPGGATPGGSVLTERLLGAFAMLAYGVMVWVVAQHWWADRGRLSLLLLLVSEGFTLALVVFARRAVVRDLSAVAIATTVFALTFFLFFGYDGTRHQVPEWVAVVLQGVGMTWQIAAKVTLGRSFGLLPASRGLVTTGPYRLVRHPIYLGYLAGHIGFLLANASWRNFAVLALLYSAQVIRIIREEQMLGTSHGYRAYCARVRWRLVPGLF